MLSFLLRILLVVLILVLLRYFMVALKGSSKKAGSKGNSARSANQMVKDPVCGMYMDSRLAVRLEESEKAFYFCSEECKKKYINRSTEAGAGSTSAR